MKRMSMELARPAAPTSKAARPSELGSDPGGSVVERGSSSFLGYPRIPLAGGGSFEGGPATVAHSRRRASIANGLGEVRGSVFYAGGMSVVIFILFFSPAY